MPRSADKVFLLLFLQKKKTLPFSPSLHSHPRISKLSLPPAVTIHSLADARAALGPALPVTLLSAPGAALYAGPGWWRALVIAAEAPLDILDCADAPGQAMAALRLGQQRLVLAPDCPAFAAVTAAADALSAQVLPHRPPALDLGEPAAARHLLAWLQGDNRAALG